MDSGTLGSIDLTLIHVHEGKNYLCMRTLVLVFVCVCTEFDTFRGPPSYKDVEIIDFDIHEFLVRWLSYMYTKECAAQ